MTSIVHRLKRETGKAVFEAHRALRIRRIEGHIREIRRQITQQAYQIGTRVIELSNGAQWSSVPELSAMLERVYELKQQIAGQEAEIERIRMEVPLEQVPKAPTVAPSAKYGHICPACEIELPAEALFCPQCGGPAQDVAPPYTPAPELSHVLCPNCGAPVAEEALFCPRCGSRIETQQTSVREEPKPGTVCAGCGELLPTGAVFCPVCGKKVEEQAALVADE